MIGEGEIKETREKEQTNKSEIRWRIKLFEDFLIFQEDNLFTSVIFSLFALGFIGASVRSTGPRGSSSGSTRSSL